MNVHIRYSETCYCTTKQSICIYLFNFKVKFVTSYFHVFKYDRNLQMAFSLHEFFFIKSASTGSFVDGQKEKKLSGLATVDETQEYRFDSSVGINTKGPLTKYKPKVVISYPNAAPLSLDGSVEVMNNKQKQSLDSVVVLKGIQDDPITINGTLEF